MTPRMTRAADSPTVRDGISVPPGVGVPASRSGTRDAPRPEPVRDAGTAPVDHQARLGRLPLPAEVGICLSCRWADASGDGQAATDHTRSTTHPTAFRPHDGAAPGEVG